MGTNYELDLEEFGAAKDSWSNVQVPVKSLYNYIEPPSISLSALAIAKTFLEETAEGPFVMRPRQITRSADIHVVMD